MAIQRITIFIIIIICIKSLLLENGLEYQHFKKWVFCCFLDFEVDITLNVRAKTYDGIDLDHALQEARFMSDIKNDYMIFFIISKTWNCYSQNFHNLRTKRYRKLELSRFCVPLAMKTHIRHFLQCFLSRSNSFHKLLVVNQISSSFKRKTIINID